MKDEKYERRYRLNGLLVIDKPLHKTSMDVLRIIKRITNGNKIGHAGTLDPLASGVLICCLGKATKLSAELMAATKIYRARVDLSAFTQTDDAEAEREEVAVSVPPTTDALRAALERLTGEIEQTPPIYSALKVDGQPAYIYARKGLPIELEARTVRIDAITMDAYDWPQVDLTVTCGKGTYIRSLARQLGEALGTGGHLTDLRRTAVGDFTEDQALALDALPDPLEQKHLLALP